MDIRDEWRRAGALIDRILCDTCRTGRAISPQGRVHTEVDRMAAALADMLDAHLDRFRARRAS
ncbi:MAG: hypothetical protein WB646_03530 [Steroidobacteraceae bacterium]